ncbi:hypothetical protein BS78_01G195600 [Paspalum vaginatum]|nr:hypothetical protein BS78_01G195600 [Paspalum vaginatum]
MDANSTYLLKIRMLANRKKGRKDVGCLLVEKVIDSDLINFKDIFESIIEEFPPGYLEVAHFQYFDEGMKFFSEVKSDQELMEMFSKHSKSKVVDMFVQYCDPSDTYEPITRWDFEDPDQSNRQPKKVEEDSYLKNPFADNEYVGINEEDLYLESKHSQPLQMVACSDKENDNDSNEDERI